MTFYMVNLAISVRVKLFN